MTDPLDLLLLGGGLLVAIACFELAYQRAERKRRQNPFGLCKCPACVAQRKHFTGAKR